jgi:hypothetical protein
MERHVLKNSFYFAIRLWPVKLYELATAATFGIGGVWKYVLFGPLFFFQIMGNMDL